LIKSTSLKVQSQTRVSVDHGFNISVSLSEKETIILRIDWGSNIFHSIHSFIVTLEEGFEGHMISPQFEFGILGSNFFDFLGNHFILFFQV